MRHAAGEPEGPSPSEAAGSRAARSEPGSRLAAAQQALLDLAATAAAGLTPAAVLERVARAAARLSEDALVEVWVASGTPGPLRLAIRLGARSGPEGGTGDGLATAVARAREPVTIPALDAGSPLVDTAWVRAQGLASFVGVPFTHGERLLGVLALFARRVHRFTRLEVDFLRSFGAHAAVALEGATLLEAASRRLRRLEALREIGREISQQRDPDRLLRSIARWAAELLQGDSAMVYLLDEAAGVLRPQSAVNVAPWIESLAIPLGQGVVGAVAERREGMVVNEYPRSALALPSFRELNHAVVAQPLLQGEAVQGVILVNRATPGRPFTETDLVQLGDLAVQASIALENARLLGLASARAERVKAAAQVGQLLATTRDADRILDLIAERCREVLGAEAFGLFRADPSGRLRYVRGFGFDAVFMREHSLAQGEGVVGRAAAERRMVETPDLLCDPEIVLSPEARARIERVGSRAIVAMPILARDHVAGVLAVYHAVGFRIPAEEAEFLEMLASHAAAALETSRLLAETQRYAARLERLNQINRAVSASLRLDAVLDEIVRAAAAFFEAPVVTLWLADEERRILTRRADYGDPEVLVRVPTHLAYGEAVAGLVAARRQAMLDVVVAEEPRVAAREAVLAAGIRSFDSVPILLGTRLLGVLAISRTAPEALGTADRTLLDTLVGQAAVAIQNARLYEEARAHEAEARRAYEDLKTAQDHLVRAEKLRALGEMASGVAHDFNNLLAAILGRVQLIQRKVEDPALRSWLGVIERAALDGAQTVRQIQEFTRVRRDQPTEPVDLESVIRDAVEITRTRWHDETQARGIDVRLDLALRPVPPVDGQPAELREALTNLLLNAVDALPRGGRIRIDTQLAGDRVEARVTDDGVGMPETVRRRIFEPFFSTKGPRGSGLGLAMVYGIVARHGGEVVVDSAEGQGSTFTLRLPVGRARPAPPPAGAIGLRGDAPLRILVIDDEPAVREALEQMLQLERHQVVAAGDGTAGLERFQEAPFDLVMTDLAMPGLSGWQVARAVKASRPGVPVVLVTGWGVELTPAELRQSGVDRVLAKPFRLADLQEIVASLREAL